jgi:hypothetical protein
MDCSPEDHVKIKTEAARLFFAILALILVGMLSGSLGTFHEEPLNTAKLRNPTKAEPKVARKVAQKVVVKKSSRLTDF